jgi:hypothetical protein
MAKYRISWTEELWYRMDVEADSMDEARDKFHAGEYDFDLAKNTNVELQDSVDIMEVKL